LVAGGGDTAWIFAGEIALSATPRGVVLPSPDIVASVDRLSHL